LDIHFVRKCVQLGELRVLHVPTGEHYADVMTKGLPTRTFQAFRSSLCIVSLTQQTAGGGRVLKHCTRRHSLRLLVFAWTCGWPLCRPRSTPVRAHFVTCICTQQRSTRMLLAPILLHRPPCGSTVNGRAPLFLFIRKSGR
jgi:hypothetical protein